MSLFKKILSHGRVRAAERRLSEDPSAKNYADLAQEHAVHDQLGDALRVVEEGIALHPQDTELRRVHERVRQISLEGRMRELQLQLKSAPRPAVWSELCQILIDSGRVARAEDLANEWFQSSKQADALYWRARARCERFFSDKRREDGRLAFEFIAASEEHLPSDPRPHRLRLTLASRCGAWAEARRALARLLELQPGDPALEARFRTVASLSDSGRNIDQALREIEKTGKFADEEAPVERTAPGGDVRPLLQDLARRQGVQGVFFVRGGTALVQGPKGPTADRMARGVREVVGSCRTAARKLGLGQAVEVTLEGGFGSLYVRPEEMSSAAVWCVGLAAKSHEDALRGILARGGSDAEVSA